MTKWELSWYSRLVQHSNIYQDKLPYQINIIWLHELMWKKGIWQNETPSHDEFQFKLRIEGDFLNIIKNIYKQPTANIKPKINTFPHKIGNKMMLFSYHYYLTSYLKSYLV